jgi:hypothetical protein
MSAARKLSELDELVRDISLATRAHRKISRKPRATRGPLYPKLLRLTDSERTMLAALATHWELNQCRTIREAIRRAFEAAGLRLPAPSTAGGAIR